MAQPARFRPQGQHQLAPSGQASRVAANLAALKTLRLLQAARRPAAPDEQAVLARWSGWGAVPQVFDEDRDDFAAERAELRGLLTDDEYGAARRTTINAHYTDAALAQVIWDGVAALGFDSGRVLEPGCGSGNFIGLAPPGAQVLGVELDPVTAAIAAALYPDAEVRCESFAGTRLPDGHFDLVIGNVPFSAARLHDRRHNRGGHSMHNHFIIKSLHLTKPGGLVAVLTSRYTLDAQDSAARQEMAALAGLVTAVRLPTGAHRRAAGTEAITDLLIFRRHDPGTGAAQAGWLRAVQVSLAGGTAWINEYWPDHPHHVLGTPEVGRGQYNAADLVVHPSGELSGVAGQLAGLLAAGPVTVAPLTVPARDAGRFEGTLRAGDDGTFSVLRDGLWQPWPCPATQASELRGLLGLRDTVAALLDAETASAQDTPAITGLRAGLNRRYDAYVATYGPINRTSWRRTGRTDGSGKDTWARQPPPQGRFSEDPYAAAVYALEDFDPDTGQAVKAVIFTQRVITARQPAQSAGTPADAIAICLDNTGEVRLAHAARLLGTTSQDEARTALGELVYDEPGTGRLVPAAEYLSGKVRAKLAGAERAAQADPRFAVNVTALRRVLPPDLGPGEIDARLGAAWIDAGYVQQGLREILEDRTLTAVKGHGSTWTLTGSRTSVLATEVWGTPEKDAVTLAACLLEQRPVKVSPERSDPDDPRHLRERRRLKAAAATITARAKADELNRRFADWLWEDPDRATDLVRTYNERFNSLVLRSYDGARPQLPGLASWFRPHPHQLAAVARIVNEPAALLAHDVGAGKTAEMVMGAMELQRLGLVTKPAIVVPNHMLEQFHREFLQLYPQARVLAAGAADLTARRRHKFTARIATGNWDAVIMSRSVFERIPMSAGELERYIGAQVAAYAEWLERAVAAGESTRLIKKMETRKLMREERLKRKLDRARDGGICWEQLNIDYLFIDEAHEAKNLDTRSNNPELDIDGSMRASDLEMKLHYTRSRHGRRVATFATATPIANSMTEAYVMLRYLRPDLLDDAGIEDFDAWVGTFADTTTDVEVSPEGGLRVKDRFARFRNVPELLLMWRVVADVKTSEDLKLPVPALIGGKPEVVTVEASPQLREFMATLAGRAEAVRRRAVPPEEDNMLKISGDGRKAALDPRLVGLPPPETGKLDVAALRIAQIWQDHRDDTYPGQDGNPLPIRGSLQIVFCDLGTPGGEGRWSVYDYLRGKLTGYGLDPGQVRFMHEATTDRDKAELFAAARAGKIAVLIGSTQLMGVGTNVQDRAIALHHLDCPWRPADVAQREGRILRQRNQNPQVQVIRHVTQASFDAYMWQTVTRKAKFIAQVTHGKLDERDVEDIGDVQALSYSEVTALATGDLRILAKAKADADVQRLQRLEASWRRSQQHLKTKIRSGEQALGRLREHASTLEAARARRTGTRGDAFVMRLDGQRFTTRTDAATRLRDMLRMRVAGLTRHGRAQSRPGIIGTLGGFGIHAMAVWGSSDQAWVHLGFDGIPLPAIRVPAAELELAPDKPPVGLITRLENRLADLDKEHQKALDDIARADAETERARAALGTPFGQAGQLSRARAESDRLAEELSTTPATPPTTATTENQTPGVDAAADDPAAGQTAELNGEPEHMARPPEPAAAAAGHATSASADAAASRQPEPASQAAEVSDGTGAAGAPTAVAAVASPGEPGTGEPPPLSSSCHADTLLTGEKLGPHAGATADPLTPARGEPATGDDPDLPAAPSTNSDLAAALRRLPGWEFARFIGQTGTPSYGGSWTSRRDDEPDAGAHQALEWDASGIDITISAQGLRRHGHLRWAQVASWIDAGMTPARLGLIITADRLHAVCRSHRDLLARTGKCDPDAAASELAQIRDKAISAVITAALRTCGAAAPVRPARRGQPAFHTTAMITRPDPAAGKDENTALARLAQLRAAIREPQPISAAEVRTTIRRWIGDGLPDYVRALGKPAKMRGWMDSQITSWAGRPARSTHDSQSAPGGRWYGASPEGLLTAQADDSRAEALIPWAEIPAWIQPGITTGLRDRLLAADDSHRAVIRRRVTAAAHPSAHPGRSGDAKDDDQAARLRREAIADAWAAIEAAPPPAPGHLERARRTYQDTAPAQESLFDGVEQAHKRDTTPDPAGALDVASKQPAAAGSGPAEQRGDTPSGRAAATVPGTPAESSRHHDLPAPIDVLAAAGGRRQRQAHAPVARPQLRSTGAPLTLDDVFLGLGRLPAFVFADLMGVLDSGRPTNLMSRPSAPYSGKRAVGEPDPDARETVTPTAAGVRIQVTAANSTRAGLLSWPEVADWLQPGLTPARRQILMQATETGLRFAMTNASFRAVGESRLATDAEHELRTLASAAVSATLETARAARTGQPAAAQPSPASLDEAAALERIAGLATALPDRPPQARTPIAHVQAGDVIGHPGYKFQPFRVSASPRHRDHQVEITGRLTQPSEDEPAGQITLTLTRTGTQDPVVSVISAPARSLRSLFPPETTTSETTSPSRAPGSGARPGADAQPGTRAGQAQPAGATPRPRARNTTTTRGRGTPTPGTALNTATPGSDSTTSASQASAAATHAQEDDMPPTPAGSPPAAAPGSAAAPASTPDPAPAASEPTGFPAVGDTYRTDPPAVPPGDETRLVRELEDMLAAITEHRGATSRQASVGDDFAGIRTAFTLLRNALDLPAPGSSVRPASPGPGSAQPGPARGGHAAGDGSFENIRAAFTDLRRVLDLPAYGRRTGHTGPHPGVPPDAAGQLLDRAAEEAHACARWYRDTPEWQRITKIGRAARELAGAIRQAAGDYWAEIVQDIRVRGFARTFAARVCLAVSGTARMLATRLEQAGHHNTRIWRAAQGLHQATATFAGTIMKYPPPQHPGRMNDVRRLIDDLAARRRSPAEPGASPADGTCYQRAGTPSPVALANIGFPAPVSRAAIRRPATPARRAAASPGRHRRVARLP